MSLGIKMIGQNRLFKSFYLRIRPLVQLIFSHTDSIHRPVRFWDDIVRSARGELWRLFEVWRSSPSTKAEASMVYDCYAGGDVIDVGSYRGWYAALLSPKASPGDNFVLIEPDPRALPALLINVAELSRIFPHVRYTVLAGAAGNGGLVNVAFPSGVSGHPQIASNSVAGSGQSSIRLDDIVTTLSLKPKIVKIDVEGAEYYVLRGGETMLMMFSPDVMLEIHPNWQPDGLTARCVEDQLTRIGYVSVQHTEIEHGTYRKLWRSSSTNNLVRK